MGGLSPNDNKNKTGQFATRNHWQLMGGLRHNHNKHKNSQSATGSHWHLSLFCFVFLHFREILVVLPGYGFSSRTNGAIQCYKCMLGLFVCPYSTELCHELHVL